LEEFTQEIITRNRDLNWTPAKAKSVILYYIRRKLLTPVKYRDLVAEGVDIPPMRRPPQKITLGKLISIDLRAF
jgi:hypothetical protein